MVCFVLFCFVLFGTLEIPAAGSIRSEQTPPIFSRSTTSIFLLSQHCDRKHTENGAAYGTTTATRK